MSHRFANILITAGLISAMVLSWHGLLDSAAKTHIDEALKRALITYAVTRSLNGVISVAQGTEIALQPAGVGVTLSVGEILDPLNDLVERFSWLTLMAATSLGIQSLMAEIFSQQSVNVLVTLLLLTLGGLIWLHNQSQWRRRALRLALVLVIFRFSFALVALCSSLFNETFLLQRAEQSRNYLLHTETVIESSQLAPAGAAPQPDDSVLDRFNNFLDQQKKALQFQSRLADLKARVEGAVDHIVTLMAVFLIQTILLPLLILYLVMGAIKLSWRQLAS